MSRPFSSDRLRVFAYRGSHNIQCRVCNAVGLSYASLSSLIGIRFSGLYFAIGDRRRSSISGEYCTRCLPRISLPSSGSLDRLPSSPRSSPISYTFGTLSPTLGASRLPIKFATSPSTSQTRTRPPAMPSGQKLESRPCSGAVPFAFVGPIFKS